MYISPGQQDQGSRFEKVAVRQWGQVSQQRKEGRSCENGCTAYHINWQEL